MELNSNTLDFDWRQIYEKLDFIIAEIKSLRECQENLVEEIK